MRPFGTQIMLALVVVAVAMLGVALAGDEDNCDQLIWPSSDFQEMYGAQCGMICTRAHMTWNEDEAFTNRVGTVGCCCMKKNKKKRFGLF